MTLIHSLCLLSSLDVTYCIKIYYIINHNSFPWWKKVECKVNIRDIKFQIMFGDFFQITIGIIYHKKFLMQYHYPNTTIINFCLACNIFFPFLKSFCTKVVHCSNHAREQHVATKPQEFLPFMKKISHVVG